MTKKEKFAAFVAYFEQNMPVAETELRYVNPYELLVAVILSAQCTDKRVNIITPDFFKEFPTPEVLAVASQDAVFERVKSCSYPNNKARNLIGMAQVLLKEFNGVVPEEVDQLQKLPGVGRKTANVIASVVYNKPAMAVDTHVFRVAARIGLTTKAKNPLEAEKQLVKYLPDTVISRAHHWLILHGRYVCKARTPDCNNCGIQSICNFYKRNNKDVF
ncbi:MAG: endonuclease III [Bacteroidetes bacterium]|nr:endonuclease III [Bacteroidota bacterium]MBU1577995.1 endonuclease III [Bacteroidota bacterium]MBU2465353.1 endonuclease III [Bacteroidota bacterium]MBU2556846.1 endonuclease III [Bacteroidota bacterium]